MTSRRERPPEINPVLKLSIGSVISNPIPDEELLSNEGKKNLYYTIICIIFDLVLTLLIILQENYCFSSKIKNNILKISLKSFLCIISFSLIMYLFLIHIFIVALIARFGYLILGSAYYIAKFVIKLLNLFNEINLEEFQELNMTDLIFLFIHLITIIPRILSFFLSKKYIQKLQKLQKIKNEEEHQNFIEKIAARIEKGYTRWSNPNASYINDNDQIPKKNNNKYFDRKEDENNKEDACNDNEIVLITLNENTEKEEEDNVNNFNFEKND